MPNLAALRFRSLTPVSSSLPSADRLSLSAGRVYAPVSLLAGRGVLLCSTSGRPVLPSAVRIGVYMVLHPLCGDWPSLWSIGPTMFLRVPARHSWPLTLPHRSIASGRSYRRSLRSVFPHVTALLAHHLLHTEHLTVPVSSGRRSVRKPPYQPTIALDCVARAYEVRMSVEPLAGVRINRRSRRRNREFATVVPARTRSSSSMYRPVAAR